MIVCDDAHVEEVRKQLGECVRLLDHYEWLINSFVLDFFLDSHWSHLPASWQPTLTSIPPAQLAAWLDPQVTFLFCKLQQCLLEIHDRQYLNLPWFTCRLPLHTLLRGHSHC